MILTEKEMTTVKDLQTQEKTCIEKYQRYSGEAKDTVLKDLFKTLQGKEQEHFNSLQKVIDGSVPTCNCNDTEGRNYNPKATYDRMSDSADKKTDNFLATDCIVSEKQVSSEYNTNVFCFKDSSMRKLLADIQVEEQNHAEMLYKYKTVNGMA